MKMAIKAIEAFLQPEGAAGQRGRNGAGVRLYLGGEIHVGPSIEEQLGHIEILVVSGDMQRGKARLCGGGRTEFL